MCGCAVHPEGQESIEHGIFLLLLCDQCFPAMSLCVPFRFDKVLWLRMCMGVHLNMYVRVPKETRRECQIP